MKVVCGPRIDPASVAAPEGVELVGYVHDLSRELAACDVAVTHGGLTTCMELAAAKRPFLYAPLERHFEQRFHVRHRLERYGAGRMIDYAESTPESIADGLVAALEGRREPFRRRARRRRARRRADRGAALVVVVDRAHAEREHQPAEHDHHAEAGQDRRSSTRSCRISERSPSIT